MDNIGLVLEGGGMRGVFSAGVLDYFLEKGLYIKNCISVSAGAAHGCSYMCKQTGRSIEVTKKYLNDKRYCSFYSLITTGDLFGAKLIYEEIPQIYYPIDNAAYIKSNGKFQVVLTNCITGEAEYPLVKNMNTDCQYIRASASLPGLSRMVILDEIPYLDGGMVDSIPIKQSINQGNTKNIVILTQERKYRKCPSENLWFFKIKYRKYPKLYEAIANRHIRYNETLDFIFEEECKGNIFVINPMISLNIGRTEKNMDKLIYAYNIGRATAEERYDELMAFLQR